MAKIPKFFIGIDNGGTKTELLISNESLKKIFIKKYPSLHYSVHGAKKASDEISKNIKSALKERKLSLLDCIGISIGMAGAREQQDRDALKRLFVKNLMFERIRVFTDAAIATYGAFNGEDGMLLISGTGSVLYGKHTGKITRVGGWGRIIGDEGSGYKIGRDALSVVSKEYDEEPLLKSKSMLRRRIESNLSLNKKNLIEQIFEKQFPIQNAAPVVIKCAESGDKTALNIIDNAVEGLLYHIRTFVKINKISYRFNIAFIGSIIQNDNILSRKLRASIKSEFKFLRVIKNMHSPSYGAVLMAEETFAK